MKIYLQILGLVTSFIFSSYGLSQDTIGDEEYKIIKIDLFEGTIDDYLPFDVPFLMGGAVSDNISKLEFFFAPSKLLDQKTEFRRNAKDCSMAEDGTEISQTINLSLKSDPSNLITQTVIDETVENQEWGYTVWKRPEEALRAGTKDTATKKPDTFYVSMPPLKPNRNYSFFVRVTYKLPVSKEEVLDELKNHTRQKNLENLKSFDRYFEEAQSKVQPLLDTIGVQYTRTNLIKYLTPVKVSIIELTENDEKIEFLQGSVFTAAYLDSADQKILYANMAKRVNKKLELEYGIQVHEDSLVKVINAQLSDEMVAAYTKLNWDHLLLSIEINDIAANIILKDDEIRNLLTSNNLVEQITEYDKLRDLREARSFNLHLNTGVAEFGTSNRFTFLDQISSSKELDNCIVNVQKLIGAIAEVKSKMKSGLIGDKLSSYINPYVDKALKEDLDKIQKEIAKEKDSAKLIELEYRKVDIENTIKWLKSKSGKDLWKLLEIYEEYISNLRNDIIPKLIQLRLNYLSIEEFWNNLERNISIKVESNDYLASAFQHTTTNNFMTRAEYYISADFGLAGMYFGVPGTDDWGLKTIQPYLGVNFNLFPINRQAHYNLLGTSYRDGRYTGGNFCAYWKNVFRGSSIVLGMTNRNVGFDVYGNNDDVKSLWDGTNIILMTGYGVRLSDYFRITVGTSWYRYRESISPFADQQYKLAAGFYFSLSADLDVKKLFGTIGTLITARS